MARPEHIAYYKKGRPFTDFLDQNKRDTSKGATSRPGNNNTVYQSTPQTFPKAGPPNTVPNNTTYPERRREDPALYDRHVPQVNTASSDSNAFSGFSIDESSRMCGSKRKRLSKLLSLGVPRHQAIELSEMHWPALEQLPFIKDLQKKATAVQRQGSDMEMQPLPQETDNPLFNSHGMNNRMYPEPRREDPNMFSRQVAGQENADDDSNAHSINQPPKMSGGKRRRLSRLINIGVPKDQALELCEMPWHTIEQMPFVKDLLKKAIAVQRQGSVTEIQLLPQETDNPHFRSQGMNNEMYPEPRRVDPNMFSKQVAGQNNTRDDSNALSTNEPLKMTSVKRKRLSKLLSIGVPNHRAMELCEMPWQKIELIPFVQDLLKKATADQRQGSVTEIELEPQETDNPLFSSQGILGCLRVGIRNTVPMTEAQMKAVHHHLILAITEQWADGGGPEFLGFFIKIDWILVTCANQRSKEWLVNEVPFLEPWPGAQLSIIPENELPKPPRGIAFFPTSEVTSFKEALHLLKAQNKGLNTELWKLLSEKMEDGGRTVTFFVDEPSAETLKAQDCQVALGFTKVTIKIKSINRTFAGYASQSQNQVPASSQGNTDSSTPQGSQMHVNTGSKPFTHQDGSIAGGYPMPQVVETQSHHIGQTSVRDQPRAQNATGQMDPARGMSESQPSHGSRSFTDNEIEGAVGRGFTSSAREQSPQASWVKGGSWSKSQSKNIPLIQDRSRGDRTLLDQDMRPNADVESSEGRHTRDGSYRGTAFSKETEGKGFTKPTFEVRSGFGNQPIILDSRIKKAPLIQGGPGGDGTLFDQDMRASTDDKSAQGSRRGNSFSKDNPYVRETRFSHNENEGSGFKGPTFEVRFGTKPNTLDSQSKKTPLIQGRIEGDKTYDQDMRKSADKSAQGSRGQNSFSRDNPSSDRSGYSNSENEGTRFPQPTFEVRYGTRPSGMSHTEGTGFTKPTSQARGGFGAPPLIQNSLSGMAPLNQSRSAGVQQPNQVGFSAAANSQDRDLRGRDGTFGQANTGGGDTASDRGGFSGHPQANSGFGDKPIIRASRFEFNQDRNAAQVSGPEFSTNQTPRGQGSRPGNQDTRSRRSGTAQDVSGVDLTVVDMEESSGDEQPEEEGGYSSWVIEDPVTYGHRIIQVAVPGTLVPATGPSNWNLMSQCNDITQFNQGNSAGMNGRGDMTSNSGRGLLPHPSGSFQSSAGTDHSKPGLLPHPKDNYGSLTQDESLGRPFQGSQVAIEEPRPSIGLLPHPAGSFGMGMQESGIPFQGNQMGTEGMPNVGLLPHPSGCYGMGIQASGIPFQDSSTMDEPRPNTGLLPHPNESYGVGIQDAARGSQEFSQGSRDEPRSDRGPLSHPKGYEGRSQDRSHGRSVEDRGRGSRDRRPSPQARGYSSRNQDPEGHRRRSRSPQAWRENRGRFQDRERTNRDLRSDRLSPGSHGRQQDRYNRWDESSRFRGRDRERPVRGLKGDLERSDCRDRRPMKTFGNGPR